MVQVQAHNRLQVRDQGATRRSDNSSTMTFIIKALIIFGAAYMFTQLHGTR